MRNGIIPASFADQGIKFRIPYTMPGEFLFDPATNGVAFPENSFQFNRDKPFEIWRMNVRIAALLQGALLFPQPAFIDMANRVRLSVQDSSKNELLTQAFTRIENLITSDIGYAGTWEWEVPYTLVRNESLIISANTDAYPAGVYDQLRISIALQGFLLVIQEASETR